ncbi:MAG: prevent-host-death protein [Pseudanabaena sp.]
MTLAELLPAARKLTVTEKVKLIRILAEDLDTDENNQLSESSKNQNLPTTITPKSKKQRPFGLCAGEFVVPEDFDAPLPEEILNAFEGK